MSSRGWQALLLVCAVLLLSGCFAVTSGDGPDAGTVVERVEQKMNETEAFQARLIQQQQVAGETTEMEAIVAYEAPGKINITYLSPQRFAGTRVVSNGSTTMIYNPDTGTASVQPTQSAAGQNASTSGLFFGLSSVDNGTRIQNTATSDGAVSLSYAADGQQFSLFVGGSPNRQSRLHNTEAPVETTVWIDRDRWLPTKARLNYTNMRVPMIQTIEYENFTTMEDVPDDRFSTEPPGDARMREGTMTPFMDENMTSYLSRSAMVEAVDQPVPEPEVPDRFSFRRGMTMGNDSFVWEIYGNATDVLQIQRIPGTVSVFQSDRTVAVHGEAATLTRVQGQRIVEWHCGGSTFALYGTASAFDAEDLADIAESIECR
mgnify:CR=1 FL=1